MGVSLCRLWLGLRFFLCSPHPFSFFFFSSASSVSVANWVSGVATSALGGGSDSAFSRDVFSIVTVTVPEIHWLLSDLLAFPDNDDTFLSFCLRSHDPVFFSRILSHDIC